MRRGCAQRVGVKRRACWPPGPLTTVPGPITPPDPAITAPGAAAMTACICWALATTAPGGTIDAWTLIVFPGGVCPPSGPRSGASVGGASARGGVESGPDMCLRSIMNQITFAKLRNGHVATARRRGGRPHHLSLSPPPRSPLPAALCCGAAAPRRQCPTWSHSRPSPS